jgi:hypothetical protein
MTILDIPQTGIRVGKYPVSVDVAPVNSQHSDYGIIVKCPLTGRGGDESNYFQIRKSKIDMRIFVVVLLFEDIKFDSYIENSEILFDSR